MVKEELYNRMLHKSAGRILQGIFMELRGKATLYSFRTWWSVLNDRKEEAQAKMVEDLLVQSMEEKAMSFLRHTMVRQSGDLLNAYFYTWKSIWVDENSDRISNAMQAKLEQELETKALSFLKQCSARSADKVAL